MAVGSYDANGIWQYGESDNISPFATTLNKLAASTSSGFTADRARIATLESGSLAALIPVAPTSVNNSGGSVAVNSIGRVSFTGVNSVSLNGVFTATYNHYKILITDFYGTADVYGQIRFRSAGTDNTSALYYTGMIGYANTTQFNNFASNETFTKFVVIGAHGTHSAAELTITNPSSSKVKNITGTSRGNYGGNSTWVVGGAYDATTIFDGLTLYPSGGTITGHIQVFGWNV